MKKTSLTICMAALCASAIAHDSQEAGVKSALTKEQIEVMSTGRYTSVKNIAPVDQLNPLKVVIKTKLPQSIATVREAVDFLLVRSGYTMAEDGVLSAEAKTLMALPLPAVHRELGPMTLDRALHTLSGDAFVLVVDPVHRKIGYELAIRVEATL